jgi:hypothetical protein
MSTLALLFRRHWTNTGTKGTVEGVVEAVAELIAVLVLSSLLLILQPAYSANKRPVVVASASEGK